MRASVTDGETLLFLRLEMKIHSFNISKLVIVLTCMKKL